MTVLHRRAFLRGALAQVGAGAVLTLVGCRAEVDCALVDGADKDWKKLEPDGRTQALLDAYFGERRRDIKELGRAYRDGLEHPRPVLDDFTCEHIEGSRSLSEALDAVHAALQADFEDWNTVTLHGWVLAETELLLCALATYR